MLKARCSKAMACAFSAFMPLSHRECIQSMHYPLNSTTIIFSDPTSNSTPLGQFTCCGRPWGCGVGELPSHERWCTWCKMYFFSRDGVTQGVLFHQTGESLGHPLSVTLSPRCLVIKLIRVCHRAD